MSSYWNVVEGIFESHATARRHMAVGVVSAVVVVAALLLFPREFASSGSFSPSSGQNRAGDLAAAAAGFGLDIGGLGSNGDSPDFYADLMSTRTLLERVVLQQYHWTSSGDSLSGDLTVFYKLNKKYSRPRALEETVQRLRDGLRTNTGLKTGVVAFNVTTTSAQVSQQIANEVLSQVDEFNRHIRNTQGRAQRIFLESRLGSAQADERQAADSVKAFVDANRAYKTSADLSLQFQRLSEDLTSRSEIIRSLRLDLEKARVREVQDTPVITILDRPAEAARPVSRQLALKGILVFLIGALVSLLFANRQALLR